MSSQQKLAEIIAEHERREGPLLPILHDVQEEFGCVDENAEKAIAHALNLSRADVHGVVSFYHDFKPAADPRPEVQICRAEACKARGVEALMDEASSGRGRAGEAAPPSIASACAAPARTPAWATGSMPGSTAPALAKLIENA